MSKYKSENAIQQECYMWFHNTYPNLRGLLFAVPNGGARSAVEGKLLKDTGVVPGVSDLIFLYKGKATMIEMKTLSNHQSIKQLDWEKKVKSHGFEYFVIRDLESFIKLINCIINNRDLELEIQSR